MSSRMQGRDGRRVGALTVAAAVLVAGCVEQDAPGVGIEALSANVIFGVALDDAPDPAPPPALVQVPQPVQVPSIPPIKPPAFEPVEPPPLPEPPPVARCPVAGLNAFPLEAAAVNVAPDRRPAEGDYLWVRSGNQRRAEFLNIPIPISGFDTRTVSDLVEESESQFSYTTTQLDLAGNTVVRTWQVRTDGTKVGPDDLPVTVPPTDVEGDGEDEVGPDSVPTIGEPDRGLALLRVEYFDPDGEPLGRFEPATPLLLLPLPVRVQESFSSQAVDPTTFETWAFTNAVVEPVDRVDACGEIVEGFGVSGTLSFTDSEGATQTATYRLVVALQMGGLVVLEETHTGTEDASGMDLVEKIGQLTPDQAEGGTP